MSSGHHKPHVGGDGDYVGGRTTIYVLHTMMNPRTDVGGGGGVYKGLLILAPPGKDDGDIPLLAPKSHRNSRRYFRW